MADHVMNILVKKFKTELQDYSNWTVESEGNSLLFLKNGNTKVVRIHYTTRWDFTGYHPIGMRVIVESWSWLKNRKPIRCSSFKPESIEGIVKRAMMIIRAWGDIQDGRD